MHRMLNATAPFYLSGEDHRFYKRGIDQYPARLSSGFQSPTEIRAMKNRSYRKFRKELAISQRTW